jgi:FkbM family methyltransferase
MVPDLIYDLGMHDGSDTAYYLSLGYRVVSVEANPKYVERCRIRFADAIQAGRLHIEPVGIGPEACTSDLYVNEVDSVWTSFDPSFGTRGGRFHVIPVPCVPFETILRCHGVPYYLKSDIEGADPLVLAALNRRDVPAFLSIEAHCPEYLTQMYSLGYRRFQLVDQTRHNNAYGPPAKWSTRLARRGWHKLHRWLPRLVPEPSPERPFPFGSSGPFGPFLLTPWKSMEAVMTEVQAPDITANGSWFDFHARLE